MTRTNCLNESAKHLPSLNYEPILHFIFMIPEIGSTIHNEER